MSNKNIINKLISGVLVNTMVLGMFGTVEENTRVLASSGESVGISKPSFGEILQERLMKLVPEDFDNVIKEILEDFDNAFGNVIKAKKGDLETAQKKFKEEKKNKLLGKNENESEIKKCEQGENQEEAIQELKEVNKRIDEILDASMEEILNRIDGNEYLEPYDMESDIKNLKGQINEEMVCYKDSLFAPEIDEEYYKQRKTLKDGDCDENGLKYELKDVDERTAILVGCINKAIKTLDIPMYVVKDEIEYKVKEIGDRAFEGCSGFKGDLIIPESVEKIGAFAFSGCSGFKGRLTIPKGVKEIGAYAFYGCSGLTGDLTIPKSVKEIGEDAFEGCSGLTGDLTIPKKVIELLKVVAG